MGSDVTKAYGAIGRSDLLQFDPDQLIIVQADPDHPLYDPRASWGFEERKVRTMMRVGCILPIVVRLNGTGKDGRPRVEVVEGRQRVINLREANRRLRAAGEEPHRIEAVRRRGDDDSMRDIIVIANSHRQDDPPSMRAKRMAYCRDVRKLSTREIADLFDVDERTVRTDLALVECAPAIVKEVDAGRLAVDIAAELSAKPREEQAAALEKLRAEGAARGAAGRHAARQLARGRDDGEERVPLPGRSAMRRLLGKVEEKLEAHPGETELRAARQLLRLLLEGKNPRGSTVGDAWREVLREDAARREARAARKAAT